MTPRGDRPRPGEFRVARADGALPCLVVVLDVPKGEDFCNVAMVSNDVELATEADVRLAREETGLRYDVLVQSNVVAPVFTIQLGPPIGRLPNDVADVLLLGGHVPDLSNLPLARIGLPLVRHTDQRWAWKRHELRLLLDLARECIAAELEAPAEATLAERLHDRVAAFAPMIVALRRRAHLPGQGAGPNGPILERLTIPFRLQPAPEPAFRAATMEAAPGTFDIVRESYVPQESADFVIELRQRGDRLALTGRGFGDLSGKDLALVVTLTKKATRTVVLEARGRRRVVELRTTVVSDGSFVAPLGHLRHGADPDGPMLEEVEVVAA